MTETKPVEAAPKAAVEAGAVAEGRKPVETAATELAAVPEAAPKAAVEVAAVVQTDGQKFLAAFGDKGGVWFAEGKSFAEAQALHLADLKSQLAVKDTEIADLKTRLSALPRGEGAPLPIEPSDAPQGGSAARKLKQTTGDKLEKIITIREKGQK